MVEHNPVGMDGIAWIEFSAPDDEGLASLHRLFVALGFSMTKRHRDLDVVLYEQNEIVFLVTKESDAFARRFAKAHGPCASAMGVWVEDADEAVLAATERGAEQYTQDTLFDQPAVYGIGDSLLYFMGKSGRDLQSKFIPLEQPEIVPSRGFYAVDHLTNNVRKGTMEQWSDFYKTVFGFTEVRHFDIRGEKTGLTSYALRSPCGKFCIPINEGDEKESQIEEYLREYKGPGIQHIALLSNDLLTSLDNLSVETLDIDDTYYDEVFDRVPNVREPQSEIKAKQVLVDGDDEGYLLQIFTKNVIGPIFFEMIQRRNHLSFGEGNFGALFRSIERDQERRGVI